MSDGRPVKPDTPGKRDSPWWSIGVGSTAGHFNGHGKRSLTKCLPPGITRDGTIGSMQTEAEKPLILGLTMAKRPRQTLAVMQDMAEVTPQGNAP